MNLKGWGRKVFREPYKAATSLFESGAENERRMAGYDGKTDEYFGSDNTNEAAANMAEAAKNGDWGAFANEFLSRQTLTKGLIKLGIPKEVADQIGDKFAEMFSGIFEGILGNGGKKYAEDAERLNQNGANGVTKDQVKDANALIKDGKVQADPAIVKQIQDNPEYAGIDANAMALQYAALKQTGADVTVESVVKAEQQKAAEAKAKDEALKGTKQYANLGFSQSELQAQGINVTEKQLQAADNYANPGQSYGTATIFATAKGKDVDYVKEHYPNLSDEQAQQIAKTYNALSMANVEGVTLDQVANAQIAKQQQSQGQTQAPAVTEPSASINSNVQAAVTQEGNVMAANNVSGGKETKAVTTSSVPAGPSASPALAAG